MPKQHKYKWGIFTVTQKELEDILDLYTIQEVQMFYDSYFTVIAKYQLSNYLNKRIMKQLDNLD
jgi:hypothetical protein